MNYLLTQAVIEQLGYDELNDDCKDELKDVAAHGATGDFGNFIYYSDTVKFFDDNKIKLRELLKEQSDAFGIAGSAAFVKGFKCLNDEYSIDEVTEVLFNVSCDNDTATQVKNAVTWFALETLAQEVESSNGE